MIATLQVPSQPSLEQLQAKFLRILPRIEVHARIFFRGIQCPHKREDRIAETVALAWKWHLRLAEQGKDATHFPAVLATYAAKAVKAGRRLAGMERAKDVMNERTQQRRGFAVGRLPDFSTLSSNPLTEALADNTRTPLPDAVAFRLDFPAWQRSYSQRNRCLINDMMLGHRTMALARMHRLSPARVSQLRREFHQDWKAFCGEPTVVEKRVFQAA